MVAKVRFSPRNPNTASAKGFKNTALTQKFPHVDIYSYLRNGFKHVFSMNEGETNRQKISRGSMVYYFKNKEGLFREILHTFVYRTSSVKTVPDAYKLSLCSFYNYFIETLKREQKQMSSLGIANVNEALMRIESSALTYIPKFKEQTAQWYEEERLIWKSVIENAIATGEIRNGLDPAAISYFYEDCYIGRAFHGVFSENGYDIDRLKQTYDQLYALLK